MENRQNALHLTLLLSPLDGKPRNRRNKTEADGLTTLSASSRFCRSFAVDSAPVGLEPQKPGVSRRALRRQAFFEVDPSRKSPKAGPPPPVEKKKTGKFLRASPPKSQAPTRSRSPNWENFLRSRRKNNKFSPRKKPQKPGSPSLEKSKPRKFSPVKKKKTGKFLDREEKTRSYLRAKNKKSRLGFPNRLRIS